MHDVATPYACIPLTVGGRSAAALRLLHPLRSLTNHEIQDAATVAQRYSVRFGVLRLLMSRAKEARTDPLTGVINRRVIEEALDALMKRERVDGDVDPISVLMIDLDRFKAINDAHGHSAGDDALCAFVNAAQEVLPDDAVFGRVGGEEFMVIVPRTAAAAVELGKTICAAVRRRRQEAGFPMATVSIGVATSPGDAESRTALVRCADDRLFIAKDRGRDQVCGCPPDSPANITPSDGLQTVVSLVAGGRGGRQPDAS